MSNLASSVTIEEQRVFIKFQVLLGTPVHEIEKLLKKTVGNNAMKRPTIIKWVERFQQGETSAQDQPRSGRPKSSRDESHKEKLAVLLEESRSWTTRELSHQLDISKDSVHKMLVEDFGMRKVCAKWVPHQLTPEQREVRTLIAQALLSRYKSDPRMLDRVIAIDETWVRCYEPTKKQATAEWHTPDEPR